MGQDKRRTGTNVGQGKIEKNKTMEIGEKSLEICNIFHLHLRMEPTAGRYIAVKQGGKQLLDADN